MKILYLCTFYHRALLFRQQMDALNRLGHEVYAFSSAQYGEGIADKFKPIMDDLVVHRECWNKLDRALFFPRQWKIEHELKKSYDLKSFDLICSHLLLSSGYSALRLKRQYGVPYVVSVRVTDLKGFIRIPFFCRMANDILKNASGILFLSKVHKDELLEKYVPKNEWHIIEEKSVVIGNCLEPFWSENVFHPRSWEGKEEKEVKILSVAKINPIKNLPIAAEAVTRLNQAGYKATLTVIGEIQDQAEFEKIKNCPNVSVLPFMSKEELIGQYRQHDVFLLPSINETFGRVYTEAMTQGIPVLYTKGQGFDETFPDGVVGYAVPYDDPAAIAEKVIRILENYSAISESCINNCSAFSEDRIIEKLEAFLVKSVKEFS